MKMDLQRKRRCVQKKIDFPPITSLFKISFSMSFFNKYTISVQLVYRKDETQKGFRFNFSVDSRSTNSMNVMDIQHLEHIPISGRTSFLKQQESSLVINNAHSVKVTVPEKRVRVEKPATIQQEMLPPPPVQPTPEPMNPLPTSSAPLTTSSASLITTIQGEVEQKLEQQKKENRDVMETVTVRFNG